jgi:hypothetical protein
MHHLRLELLGGEEAYDLEHPFSHILPDPELFDHRYRA